MINTDNIDTSKRPSLFESTPEIVENEARHTARIKKMSLDALVSSAEDQLNNGGFVNIHDINDFFLGSGKEWSMEAWKDLVERDLRIAKDQYGATEEEIDQLRIQFQEIEDKRTRGLGFVKLSRSRTD